MVNPDFAKHEFVELASLPLRDMITRVHKLDPKGKLKNEQFDNLLSENEKYTVDVFSAIMGIVKMAEELRFVHIFLSNFPPDKRFSQYGINKAKYLQYHLEIHFIKITTIRDQMAILIEKVFNLGIPERKCTVDTIPENDHTRHSNAAKALRLFDKSIQEIKTARNLVVHRGSYKNQELNELRMYYYLWENPIPGEEPLFSDWALKFKAELTRKKILAVISHNNEAVNAFVSKSFNSLMKEFKRRHGTMAH